MNNRNELIIVACDQIIYMRDLSNVEAKCIYPMEGNDRFAHRGDGVRDDKSPLFLQEEKRHGQVEDTEYQ